MKIKKGDTVVVIKGEDRGQTGRVLKSFPKQNRILVEGVNLKKRHVAPESAREKGEIVAVPGPINASNVKLVCSNCGQGVRVGYEIKSKSKDQKSKIRVCRKCGKEI